MSEELAEVEQLDVDITNISDWIISAGVNHGYTSYTGLKAITVDDPSNLMYEKNGMLAGSSLHLMVSVRGCARPMFAIRINVT